MRIGIVGYGTVASIHARQLASESSVTRAVVIGPDLKRARRFANAYGFADAADKLEDALARVDAVIVCSPSALHYEHACTSLRHGVATLVELPPCENGEQAAELGREAQDKRVLLRCAHTSRYLLPYVHLKEALKTGQLGSIEQITYIRHHKPIERHWTDDALIHHAAHPVDLLLDWFGEVVALGCVISPKDGNPRSASILARVEEAAGVTIGITYASHLPHGRLLVVGDRHAMETDGFSYVRSDNEALELSAEGQTVYERAIHDQDVEFIRASRGKMGGVDWNETVRLMRMLDALRRLAVAAGKRERRKEEDSYG